MNSCKADGEHIALHPLTQLLQNAGKEDFKPPILRQSGSSLYILHYTFSVVYFIPISSRRDVTSLNAEDTA